MLDRTIDEYLALDGHDVLTALRAYDAQGPGKLIEGDCLSVDQAALTVAAIPVALPAALSLTTATRAVNPDRGWFWRKPLPVPLRVTFPPEIVGT